VRTGPEPLRDFYGILGSQKLRSFPFSADAAVCRLALGCEKPYTNRAVHALRGRSSVVERQLPKLYVEGSIPFARSKFPLAGQGLVALLRIDAAARDGAADESRQ
jgi:hypothetical protein